MGKQVLCILISALLSCAEATARQTQPNRGGSVKSQIQALGTDSLVEVRLSDRSKLRGWIGAISENDFELRLGKAKLENRTLGFDQVRSVKPAKSLKPSHTMRNVLIGVGVGVAAAAVGTILAFKRIGWI